MMSGTTTGVTLSSLGLVSDHDADEDYSTKKGHDNLSGMRLQVPRDNC